MPSNEKARPGQGRAAISEPSTAPMVAPGSDVVVPSVKRPRATKSELDRLDLDLVALIGRAGPPCTARQVYYMAVGAGLLPKVEASYRKVIRRLSALRESGSMPWSHIADNTRWVRQREQYASVEDALADWQASYRRDYWQTQPYRVELWVESDSIASFINETVMQYGLPMFVCKGQASKVYVRGAAETAQAIGKPVKILFVGDFDPTGLAIDRSVVERYDRYGDVDLTLDRIAATPAQVTELGLIGTPAKQTDPNYARFAAECGRSGLAPMAYETESIHPAMLRDLIRDAIEATIEIDAWRAVIQYERAERDQLASLIGGVR